MQRRGLGTKLHRRWSRFWLRRAGLGALGRAASRLAVLGTPPYFGRRYLATLATRGYIAPSAQIHHAGLQLGIHVFVGDRVVIYQDEQGGTVSLGDRTHLYGDSYLQTGQGGSISIDADTHIQPRCQFSAYKGAIRIGQGVQIAPGCAFYPYDHGAAPGALIMEQPLQTKGDIVIGDDAWLGYGVIVLSGVRIGAGAIVGAGAVVTKDIPAGAVAVGSPARVVRMRKKHEVAAST